jgi:predicted GTPase
MVFVNDPSLVTKNYRRYLESFFRKSFGLRSAPVRLLLRTRSGADDAEEIVPGAPSRDR